MKKLSLLLAAVMMFTLAVSASATTLKENEKAVRTELMKIIPHNKHATTDDLYKTWQKVEAGTSKAVLFDIRTEAEFDAGHIKDVDNIDSGHFYGIPKKITDPDAEIWIFCRTGHRAGYFTAMLYKYGYKNAYFVKGGVKEWGEKGYPLVTKYLGEIKVTNYQKKQKETFKFRENK